MGTLSESPKVAVFAMATEAEQIDCFGPYGLFRTMIGPSCRITVPFMLRNVQRQDQVSKGSFVYTFCNFHYLCAPFDPFWSIFGPLGPNYETI